MIGAQEIAALIAIAVIAALIVINRRGVAMIFGGVLIAVAMLLAVMPLAITLLGVRIMEFGARRRVRDDDPMARPHGDWPHRGGET